MNKINKTREQILNVAQHLFQQFGFHKTSMDEIARAAHKAKRSIYYHFEDKETLFKTVIEEELVTVREQLQGIFEDPTLSPPERIKMYLITRMELLSEAGAYQQVLKSEMRNDIDLKFSSIESVRYEFDQWEYGHFYSMSKERIEEKTLEPDFNCEAFADMLQMVLKSLDLSFFVQDKYVNYKHTFVALIHIIVDNMIQNNK